MEEERIIKFIYSAGDDSKVKKELVFLLVGIISLIIGISVPINSLLTSGIILFFGLIILFLLKKEFSVYLIILTLFFEAHIFSFYTMGARIRISQVIEVVAIIVMILFLSSGKARLKKTPLDIFLWIYIGINFLSIKNAAYVNRSLKISILLLGSALLYYVMVNFITKKELFFKTFYLLLYVGIIEVIYGLYQVFGGICNNYLNMNLPIGHSGIMQRGYLNSPWGRPYGTLLEPDWYGAIAMFYAIIFTVLYVSNNSKKKKLYLAGMVLSFTGMIFSFVRASWVGFLGAVIILMFFRNKANLSNIKFSRLYKISYYFFLLFLILLLFSPSFNSIINNRFNIKAESSRYTFGTRIASTKYAFQSFLKNPILGNGPGSLIVKEETEEYYEAIESGHRYLIGQGYEPSLITSILNDTGIIGMIFFLLLFIRYVKFNLRSIPRLETRFQIINFALFGGILGLFISYLFTHGLWMPFTWVFLALNIAGIKVAFNDNQQRST